MSFILLSILFNYFIIIQKNSLIIFYNLIKIYYNLDNLDI